MVVIGTRDDYRKVLNGRSFLGRDDCPFCDRENMKDDIIWEGKNWILLYNKYPYTGNDRHIVAVPREHKALSSELTPEEFTELHDVHARVKEFFWEENYFSFTRETFSNTRSVEHYHIHFLAGIIQGKYLRKMLENQGFPVKEDKLEVKVVIKEGGV